MQVHWIKLSLTMYAVAVVVLNVLSFASLAYVANRKGYHAMAALLAAGAWLFGVASVWLILVWRWCPAASRPPWPIEEADSELDRQRYIVRDGNGQALAYLAALLSADAQRTVRCFYLIRTFRLRPSRETKRTFGRFDGDAACRSVGIVDELVELNARLRADFEIAIIVKAQARDAADAGLYVILMVDLPPVASVCLPPCEPSACGVIEVALPMASCPWAAPANNKTVR
jgi:hypothetical protein